MIGEPETGIIAGVHIVGSATTGLSVMAHGKPGKLAILADDGTIVASGDLVAREAESVAICAYRNLLKGEGRLQVISSPVDEDPTHGQEPVRVRKLA